MRDIEEYRCPGYLHQLEEALVVQTPWIQHVTNDRKYGGDVASVPDWIAATREVLITKVSKTSCALFE